MTVEIDLREIKELLGQLNKKLDVLVEERDTQSLMMATQQSLKGFLMEEPDLYSANDLKVAYK